ncbi:hypothetical protein ABPG72_005993 [Tetrahymena utriculariae]
MEDSALLEKLKGQKWDRITADEDKGLKLLLVDQNQSQKIPYMYSHELKICLAETIQEEQIINGFSALKKLGLLKNLQIQVYLDLLADKPTFQDLLQKVSNQLGQLKVLTSLKIVQLQSYSQGQENILNDICNIGQLQNLEITEAWGVNQNNSNKEFDSIYANYFSVVFKCNFLKKLTINLTKNIECSEQLKSELRKLESLVQLEEFNLYSSIKNESFYEFLGHHISKLPNLKSFDITILRNEETEIGQFSNNIMKLSQNISKSLSLENITINTVRIGEQVEKYNQAIDFISQIKQLKKLRIVAQNQNNLFDKLNQFTSLQCLSLVLDQLVNPQQLQTLKSLTQLKRLDIFSVQTMDLQQLKDLVASIKCLKNLTYISIPDYNWLIQKVKKSLPNLVEYNVIDEENF